MHVHHWQAETRRKGATVVEVAIVLSTFLVMVLGLLDLGLAVLHSNTVSEAARRLARESIVHGARATPLRTVWGPATIDVTADADSELADVVRPLLTVIQPADVQLELVWPSGSNEPGETVRATVEYGYQPIFPFLFGDDLVSIHASSVMTVQH